MKVSMCMHDHSMHVHSMVIVRPYYEFVKTVGNSCENWSIVLQKQIQNVNLSLPTIRTYVIKYSALPCVLQTSWLPPSCITFVAIL